MTSYVLLNGPKRSGKSSCADAILNVRSLDASIAVIGMSFHLKRFVHGIYLGRCGFALDPDHFDATKEDPQDTLGGMSWREAYIHYSENVVKPLHGKRWFGEQLVRAARESDADVVAVPDSGFREEAEVLVEDAGAAKVLLIRLHRPGHGFKGDSRGYIDLSDLDVMTHDVWATEGGLVAVMDRVVAIVVDWYGRRKTDAA